MPQNRRKVAFSGKKKKDQLALKRQIKNLQKGQQDDEDETTEDTELAVHKLMEQPTNRAGGGRNRNVNRYNLQFYQESRKDLELAKQEAYKPLTMVNAKEREIGDSYFQNYDFPVRPYWRFDTKKNTLECNEMCYFKLYIDELQNSHHKESKELSLFELNLETWRQLWRVLEMSDILLIVVDVRYATLMFPPSLYQYILHTLKKHTILILNKVDLVAPEVVVAWRHYFQETYPELPVVLFASYPTRALKGTQRGRIGHKRSMAGVHNIFRECQKIVQDDVDLSTWEQKILDDMDSEYIFYDDEAENKTDNQTNIITAADANEATIHPKEQPHVQYRNGVLTLGCIGFPNVGKSSLINALKGRKVVSVSRTPGHTKHFQTIFLTNVVRLCDCPGLVFPSATPKHLQVLIGSYPISQLQVPYRSLKYLAEHLDLPQLLQLQLPEDFDDWSASAIADAWALKRGFLTAKAARPDRYRAANHLLRMCLVGQQNIVLQFYPMGFEEQKDKWLNHADLEEVAKYQNTEVKQNKDDTSSVNSESLDSYEESSSNDETTADEPEQVKASSELAQAKSANAFAVLGDDE